MITVGMRYRLGIFFLVSLCLSILLVWKLGLSSPSTSLQDFDAYMKLLTAVKEGKNPYTVSFMQTLGPPSVFLYYLPFSFFPLGGARILHTIVQLLCLYLTVFICVRQRKQWVFWWLSWFTIFLFSFPVRFALQMGQVGAFLSLCAALLVYRKSQTLNALAAALLTLAKTIFGFPLIMLLAMKKKVIVMYILILTTVCVLTFPWIRPSMYWTYLQEKFTAVAFPATAPIGNDYYNQSLRSTLYRLNIDHAYVPIAFISLLISIVVLWKTRDTRVALITSVILSPISWQHYYVILIPIALSLIDGKKDIWKMLVFLLLWGKDWGVHTSRTGTFFSGLVDSHFFFSACFLLFCLYFQQKEKRKEWLCAQERT